MNLRTLLTTGLMAAVAVAHTIERREGRKCGTPSPSEEHREMSRVLAQKELQEARSGDNMTISAFSVDVYVHIVASSSSVSGGYLSDSTVSQQIAVLNADYAASGISFVLKGTTRTISSTWSQDKNELAMKKSLRQGDYSDLNLYFLPYVSGYLGYCYFPTNAATGSNDFYYDGCTILSTSVPGGSATNYNQGKTATHEVGHWFGLYHTFEGYSCSGSGDYVSDTPQQLSETSGCPEGRDSCPSVAGLDPIHNYMDYSYDSCMTEFTAGQNTRMTSYWNNYRG